MEKIEPFIESKHQICYIKIVTENRFEVEKMNKNYQRYFSIAVAFMMILLFLPIQTSAATQTYYAGDFNKNSTITISDEKCYQTSGKLTWIKYKASKTGYVKIALSDIASSASTENADSEKVYAAGRIRMYDKARASQLSANLYYNTSYSNSCYKNVYFGVKKNTIYYFRISADQGVKMKLTLKANADKSGEKLSKAVKIKKNKAKSGIIYSGQPVSDWYKIVLTKKQVLNLYYGAKTSDTLSVRLYYGYKYMGSGKMTRAQTKEQHIYTKSKYGIAKKAKVPAGTYYVRVSGANYQSSGYYSLKWN